MTQKATTSHYDFKNETLDLIRKDLFSMQVSGMAFWVPISLSLFTIVPGCLQIPRLFLLFSSAPHPPSKRAPRFPASVLGLSTLVGVCPSSPEDMYTSSCIPPPLQGLHAHLKASLIR